jgi:hypothetical protein
MLAAFAFTSAPIHGLTGSGRGIRAIVERLAGLSMYDVKKNINTFSNESMTHH